MQGREIKFRVWDKAKCRWSTMEELMCEIPVSATVNAPSILKCGGDDYDIQMFTGLHDKNGKEIYEGDIWRNDVSMYVVFWSKEYAGFSAKVVQSDYALIKGRTFTLRQCTEDVNVVEVIGNIYENQELLEVGK